MPRDAQALLLLVSTFAGPGNPPPPEAPCKQRACLISSDQQCMTEHDHIGVARGQLWSAHPVQCFFTATLNVSH
eukprot:1156781-Pelagomonas_calceolata.AAC.11